MDYVSGKMIKELREKKKMTQKNLADILNVGDKAVSKWETGRGLPDIALISDLSQALGVSVAELFAGEYAVNNNRSANMKKVNFYVCPICGNIIQAIGEGNYNCCGIKLSKAEVEENDPMHMLCCEEIENEYYIHLDHPMKRNHYITFIAYVTSESVTMTKQYPEQNPETRVTKRGHGYIYLYCNRHGLYCFKV